MPNNPRPALWRTAIVAVGILGLVLVSGHTASAQSSSAAQAEAARRIERLEAQVRSLTGQVQEMGFQIRTLQDQMRRIQEDTEYRLQELEGGKSTGKRSRRKTETRGTIAANDTPATEENSRVLGTVPTDEDGSPPAGSSGGPLDLSALARGVTTPNPVAPSSSLPGVKTLNEPQVAAISPSVSPRDAYDSAYGSILNGDYAAAEAGFRSFLQAFPNHQLAGHAQYWVGESHFARGKYRNAADAFLKSYTDYPEGRKAPDSLLKLGLSLSGLGEPGAACATYSELLNKYPNAPRTIRKRAGREHKRGKC